MSETLQALRSGATAAILFCGVVGAFAADGWLVLKRSGTTQPEIVSVIEKLPTPSVLARFPVLLEIKWGYKALPNGMPVDEELERAKRFYSELDRIIAENGMHAMTRTGDGGRTMYYYVDSAERHAIAIREFFDAQPPISVKVTARREADWASVRKALDAAK